MRESGIDDNLHKIAMNPRRIGPDSGDKIIAQSAEFDDFSLPQLKGVFTLCIIISMLSFALFILELIFFFMINFGAG